MMQGDVIQNELKWLGAPVQSFTGTVKEIRQYLPEFDRRPFAMDLAPNQSRLQADNAFLDVIVRKPARQQDPEIPVGVVSKNYQLVQHSVILDKVVHALAMQGISEDSLVADLTITEYGERMGVHIQFPDQFNIDPGDGHTLALRIGCFNSVDGTTRFRAVLGWLRFVCSNGMVVGTARTDYKRRHNQSLQLDDIQDILDQGVALALTEKEHLRSWLETPLVPDRFSQWVDGMVADKWGVKAATRVFHIAQSGKDVEVVPFTDKCPPSEKEVRQGDCVPGSSEPATNLYAVSQVLTWLAGQRREMEDQLSWQRDVPGLMHGLARMSAVRRVEAV